MRLMEIQLRTERTIPCPTPSFGKQNRLAWHSITVVSRAVTIASAPRR